MIDGQRDALAILVDAAAQYDSDGVDIHFLNNDTHRIVKTSAQVHLLFDQVQPRGLTPLGKRLKELTDLYLDRLRYEAKGSKVKPVNYLVITDGFPSDNPAVVIADLARTLDDMRRPIKQLGIQFVQIGNDHRAAEYLRGLDGDIHALDVRRDIVDATPFNGGEKLSGEKIIKILMGGLDRDIDRRG
ncbi:hypothetical protein C8Q75DRAFT_524206 [Abortiporus biennis]|nr:hypothetical protein C8Q75DRAFT_524206 [Abortiporus biennis]